MKGLTNSFWAFAVALVLSSVVILWSHFGRSSPLTPSPLWLESVLKVIHIAAIYCVIQILSRLPWASTHRKGGVIAFRVLLLLIAAGFAAAAIQIGHSAWRESHQGGGAPPFTLLLSGFLGTSVVAGIAFGFACCALVTSVPESRIPRLPDFLMRFGLLVGAIVATVSTAAFAWLLWPDRKAVANDDFALPAFYLILVGISGGVSFLAWRLFLKSMKPVDAVLPPPTHPTREDSER